ncbi:hypothetical protein OHT76_24145 [Streptomyces sp. NBC_00287]|uniref:hypothetical protein n=1 Tax=Streptomyces sp. NBC_00287 TaxID=2975702 RepID=UPI002E28EE08|nr:hypothetical protein [Streptomyces sp. NBC_00287]
MGTAPESDPRVVRVDHRTTPMSHPRIDFRGVVEVAALSYVVPADAERPLGRRHSGHSAD